GVSPVDESAGELARALVSTGQHGRATNGRLVAPSITTRPIMNRGAALSGIDVRLRAWHDIGVLRSNGDPPLGAALEHEDEDSLPRPGRLARRGDLAHQMPVAVHDGGALPQIANPGLSHRHRRAGEDRAKAEFVRIADARPVVPPES